MSNAVKCPACGSFYNGATYSGCPYCKKNAGKSPAAAPVEQKTHGIWGIFEKKHKTEPAEPAPTPVIQSEPMPEQAPPVQPAVPLYASEPDALSVQPSDAPTPAAPPASSTNAASSGMTLSKQLSMSGRTVGKYITNSTGEGIMPVVGWLVGVEGAYRGQSFNLKNGRNKIGRSHEMDVKLLNDDSVSKSSVAVIIFDAKAGQFFIMPGDSDSLCYVNEEALYERRALSGYEAIEFGDAGMNKYIFVPFCGERFSWSNSSREK